MKKFGLESLFSLFRFDTLFIHTVSFWKWWYLRSKTLMCNRSLWRFFRDREDIYGRSIIRKIWCRSFWSILVRILFRLIDLFAFLKFMYWLFIFFLRTWKFITWIKRKPISFLTIVTARRMVWKLTSWIYLLHFLLLFFISWKIVNIFSWSIINWRRKIRIWHHNSWPVIELKNIRKLFLIVICFHLFICHSWICIFTINHLWTFKWTFHSRYFLSWILHTYHFIMRINFFLCLFHLSL